MSVIRHDGTSTNLGFGTTSADIHPQFLLLQPAISHEKLQIVRISRFVFNMIHGPILHVGIKV
jgi:hypothetical protein